MIIPAPPLARRPVPTGRCLKPNRRTTIKKTHLPHKPFSADVTLTLIASNGESYPLSEIGPKRVTLRNEAPIPSGEATIVMVVDGYEHQWAVRVEQFVMRGKDVPLKQENTRRRS